MSGVVLRCPNCGTTKAGPGECDACHEAQVRYFCTNHTPGRWLDAPACRDCGARFGEAAPPPVPSVSPSRPAPARTPPTPPATTPPPRPASTSWVRKAAGPWGRGKRPSYPEEGVDRREESAAAHDALRARLPELISRAASGIRRRSSGAPPASGSPAARPALGGCAGRLLFLMLFLLMAFFAMSLLLGGSLLQLFWVYY